MNRETFDIQPIGRFYGSSAAIRRPKVGLQDLISSPYLKSLLIFVPGDCMLFL